MDYQHVAAVPSTLNGSGAAKRKLDENAGTPTPKKIAKSEGGGAVLPLTGISPYISGRWRICGTVTGIEQLRDINSKKGPMKVFSFILSDRTGQSIKNAAFAETAEKFHPMLHENKSYYISGAPTCIRAANKRYNSTGHDYEITLNHDSVIEEAEDQKFEAPKFVIKKVDELRLFSFFANPHLYMDEQRGIYFDSIAIITRIRPDNALYQSCADCAKKVIERNGLYVCGNNHSNTTYKYRYMVSMEVADICATAWLTIFNEKAEPFFGKSAQQMGELKDTDSAAYQAIIDSKLFTMHSFRCRGKNDTYNDVTRVKYQVYDFGKPNYNQYGIALDAAIEKLETL